MKKLAFIIVFCLACFVAQAQVAVIYTNNGQCELVQGSSVDALYPVVDNGELYVRLLGGGTILLEYESLDSIVFTNREYHVSTGNATDISRTGATISGSVDWDIPATVGFLLSEDSDPNIGNGLVVAANYGTTFTANLSGLTMNTTSYYRAYAYLSGELYYGTIYVCRKSSSGTVRKICTGLRRQRSRGVLPDRYVLSIRRVRANQRCSCAWACVLAALRFKDTVYKL